MIEIRGLSCRFRDGRVALENVTLDIPAGSFTVIAGANGSGKTTLLKHINGLIPPGRGQVRVDGRDVSEDVARARRRVGMVFQNADMQIVGETVYDDVAFGPENLKLPREEIRQRVDAALAAVGLTHLAPQRPHVLSGGEKRRLAVAGILAMQPRVILFDEPFSNLDFPGTQQVLRQILALREDGHTIVITTHDLEKVIAHADSLVVLCKGRVELSGAPEAIVDRVAAFGIRPPCSWLWRGVLEPWAN